MGIRVQTFPCAVAHRMSYTSVLSICTTSAAGPHKGFFFFGERISSLPKFACEITGYPFCSIQYIAFQPLPLSSISRYEEKCFVCPSSELLWLCLSHNIIASSSSYCCSKLT